MACALPTRQAVAQNELCQIPLRFATWGDAPYPKASELAAQLRVHGRDATIAASFLGETDGCDKRD